MKSGSKSQAASVGTCLSTDAIAAAAPDAQILEPAHAASAIRFNAAHVAFSEPGRLIRVAEGILLNSDVISP